MCQGFQDRDFTEYRFRFCMIEIVRSNRDHKILIYCQFIISLSNIIHLNLQFIIYHKTQNNMNVSWNYYPKL